MALRGHVFDKQLFTSECFALFVDTFLAGNNGIIKGCEISHTNNSVTIGSGYFFVRGRPLQEVGGSTFEIETSTQDDIFYKIICEIDLSQVNTVAELKQAKYKILQSTTEYPSLQQEDITDGGTIYQFEFAQFKVTETGITNFVDKRTFLNFNSIYTEIRTNINTFLSQQNITAKEQIDALIADLQTYCNTATEVLDENVALNLLNLINTKANTPVYYTLTLLTTNWTQNGDKYEYNVADSTVTEDHHITCNMSIENQNKLKDAEGDSYDGGFTIRTTELPTEDITMDIAIQKMAKKVTTPTTSTTPTEGGNANENEV